MWRKYKISLEQSRLLTPNVAMEIHMEMGEDFLLISFNQDDHSNYFSKNGKERIF